MSYIWTASEFRATYCTYYYQMLIVKQWHKVQLFQENVHLKSTRKMAYKLVFLQTPNRAQPAKHLFTKFIYHAKNRTSLKSFSTVLSHAVGQEGITTVQPPT